MPSKSKEELAADYIEKEYPNHGRIEFGLVDMISAHVAGYAAGLESPEVKGLVSAAKDCDEWFEDHYDYQDGEGMSSPHSELVEALQAFQSKIGGAK